MANKKTAKDVFKPPQTPRDALKRLNTTLNSIKRHAELKDTQSMRYFNEARKLTKYLDDFISLIEATAVGNAKPEVSSPQTPPSDEASGEEKNNEVVPDNNEEKPAEQVND